MPPKKFTLCVFTLDEIDSIQVIMPQIDRSLFTQILVVDAGSTDGTIAWCRQQGYEVLVQKNSGIRQAYQEAQPHFRGDYVITFSPDGNSLPKKLPELIAKMQEGYDMVIVSRYRDGAKSEDDDRITAFGNWMFTQVTNVLHGGHYTDALVMFRGFRRDLIPRLKLDREDDPILVWPERLCFARIGVELLMSARASRAGFRVGEIPGDEPKRIGGERKMRVIRWGSALLLQLLMEVFLPRSAYH